MCQYGANFLQEYAIRWSELLKNLRAKHIELLLTVIFFLSCTIDTAVLRHLWFKKTIVGRMEQKLLLHIYEMKTLQELSGLL